MDSDRDNLSLDANTKERCDVLAEQLLTKIKRRKVLNDYGVIEYVEAETGDILLICADGTLLYTPGELGRQLSLKAFKNGFRTDYSALIKLCNAKTWELALA
jgi:hypothetical protein